jgi:hypothetical protein
MITFITGKTHTKIEHINKKQNTKSRSLTFKHTHKDVTQNRCFIALDKGQCKHLT